MMVNNNLVGGIPTNPSEKSESVGMMAFPTEWKVIIHGSHLPNHQPDHHHIPAVGL